MRWGRPRWVWRRGRGAEGYGDECAVTQYWLTARSSRQERSDHWHQPGRDVSVFLSEGFGVQQLVRSRRLPVAAGGTRSNGGAQDVQAARPGRRHQSAVPGRQRRKHLPTRAPEMPGRAARPLGKCRRSQIAVTKKHAAAAGMRKGAIAKVGDEHQPHTRQVAHQRRFITFVCSRAVALVFGERDCWCSGRSGGADGDGPLASNTGFPEWGHLKRWSSTTEVRYELAESNTGSAAMIGSRNGRRRSKLSQTGPLECPRGGHKRRRRGGHGSAHRVSKAQPGACADQIPVTAGGLVPSKMNVATTGPRRRTPHRKFHRWVASLLPKLVTPDVFDAPPQSACRPGGMRKGRYQVPFYRRCTADESPPATREVPGVGAVAVGSEIGFYFIFEGVADRTAGESCRRGERRVAVESHQRPPARGHRPRVYQPLIGPPQRPLAEWLPCRVTVPSGWLAEGDHLAPAGPLSSSGVRRMAGKSSPSRDQSGIRRWSSAAGAGNSVSGRRAGAKSRAVPDNSQYQQQMLENIGLPADA